MLYNVCQILSKNGSQKIFISSYDNKLRTYHLIFSIFLQIKVRARRPAALSMTEISLFHGNLSRTELRTHILDEEAALVAYYCRVLRVNAVEGPQVG